MGSRKIAPSPNSNANPKPNPDSDRGQFSGHPFRHIDLVSEVHLHEVF